MFSEDPEKIKKNRLQAKKVGLYIPERESREKIK